MGTERKEEDSHLRSCHFVLEDGDRIELIETEPGAEGLDLSVISKLMSRSSEQAVLSRLEPPYVEIRRGS